LQDNDAHDAADEPSRAPLILTDLKPASLITGDGKSAKTSVDDKGSPVGVSSSFTLDGTRRHIAFLLLGMLAAVILILVLSSGILAVSCWFNAKTDGTCPQAQASLGVLTSVFGTVFTAMVGLVGSVVGFYFGSQTKQT
jgi:hypothetical protein